MRCLSSSPSVDPGHRLAHGRIARHRPDRAARGCADPGRLRGLQRPLLRHHAARAARLRAARLAALAGGCGGADRVVRCYLPEAMGRLEGLLEERIRSRAVWAAMRDAFAARIAALPDRALYETFFNSLSRRFFLTQGVAPRDGVPCARQRARRRCRVPRRTAATIRRRTTWRRCGARSSPGTLSPTAMPTCKVARGPLRDDRSAACGAR